MAAKRYDVVIVGSGASGGWAAKELTERGLHVLVLEAGPPVDPETQFHEHTWPYELPFRGKGNRKSFDATQPIQSLCYACNEYSRQFFINDHELPYTTPQDKPFVRKGTKAPASRALTSRKEAFMITTAAFTQRRRPRLPLGSGVHSLTTYLCTFTNCDVIALHPDEGARPGEEGIRYQIPTFTTANEPVRRALMPMSGTFWIKVPSGLPALRPSPLNCSTR